jgi:tRNA-2-methylthio-N6-dimethylallyladenosine synthase
MPAQSGSTEVLKRMRRNYSREAYLELIDRVRTKIQGVTISTDMICGFCGETEEEFEDTLSLMDYVKYEQVLSFNLSKKKGIPVCLFDEREDSCS